jgi:glucose/arabinose dehydrogenase
MAKDDPVPAHGSFVSGTIAAYVGLVFAALVTHGSAWAGPPVERIRLPPGFTAETYAEVAGARSLAVVDTLSTVFVGTRGDAVYAVVDDDRDRRADRVVRVRAGLKVANGIAWHAGYLYVAEQHRIIRLPAGDLDGLAHAEPEVIFTGLPDKRHHGWRYARFGPDNLLYVSVGAPCNICIVTGLEGTIVRLRPDGGGGVQVFARGVRNSVGFDFNPRTAEMYFTDNGADWMGDDRPPDELNRAPSAGLFFGFPWFGGGHHRTLPFADEVLPEPVVFPEVEFGAHVAALGVHFYRGKSFPADYRTDAFVAQHGSWNRSVPDGYRVMRVRFAADRQPTSEVFADGFLDGRRPWGRPVDVAELADGSLLVSDDHAGAIYRIRYRGS